MKSLLLLIVLCRALSCAWPVLPSTEQATEKESQFVEKEPSNTLNERRRHRYSVPKYTLFPDFAKWENRVVTYRILNYTQKLPRADVDEIIKNAFEVWSNHTCLVFKQSWNASDIEIMFATGNYDCPFDEEYGVVAHAHSSSEDGNKAYIHFDAPEKWTKDFSGFNLKTVTIHEIGHVLGLEHSVYQESVMYKYYEKLNTTSRLLQDDIEGIQALHGNHCKYPAETELSMTTWRTFLKTRRIFTTPQRNIFMEFKNTPWFHLLWTDFAKRNYKETYIGDFWPILMCGIDAAYEVEDTLYVFYGQRYRTVSGNFKNLSSSQFFYTLGLPTNIGNMDAAVHDQETKKTLFFAGDEYRRYDEETRSTEEGYPRKIAADFPEIGSKVDAAFQYNGSLYLLRGPNQYEFDCRIYRFIDIKKTNTWFNCQK